MEDLKSVHRKFNFILLINYFTIILVLLVNFELELQNWNLI